MNRSWRMEIWCDQMVHFHRSGKLNLWQNPISTLPRAKTPEHELHSSWNPEWCLTPPDLLLKLVQDYSHNNQGSEGRNYPGDLDIIPRILISIHETSLRAASPPPKAPKKSSRPHLSDIWCDMMSGISLPKRTVCERNTTNFQEILWQHPHPPS